MYEQANHSNSDANVFRILLNMFLPYWPLFALLLPFGLVSAWIYLKNSTPIYEAAATLIIKDQNKGVDDSEVLESINPFDSKKIVENEIEVLQSRGLMQMVVKDLHLYAPVFEDRIIGDQSAYNSSPIIVELKDPDRIAQPVGAMPKFHFNFDEASNTVEIAGKKYPLDEWTNGPAFGETLFKLNPNRSVDSKNDFYFTFIPPRALGSGLLGNLQASATNKLSTVVRLTYRDAVPQRGENILNHLISAYNQKAVSDRNDLASHTLTFIEDRMKTVEKELDQLEKAIQGFKSSKGAVDLSAQGQLYLEDVGEYDRQIAASSRQLAVLDRIEKYVTSKGNQSGLVPSTVGTDDPILASLLEKLYNSEIEYERLKKTTAENNPILSSIAKEIEKIRPSIIENIKNQKNNLRASLGNLTSSVNRSSSALSFLPEKERALVELERGKNSKEELFIFLQKKREETALSYAPNGGDGRVVDLAETSGGPVSPKPLLAYVIAFLFSFGIGLGYIIFKEMMNKNVLFRKEIEENISAPVTIELPNIKHLAITGNGELFRTKVMEGVDRLRESKTLYKITNLLTRKPLEPQGGERRDISVPIELDLTSHFKQLAANLGLYNRGFVKKSVLITSSLAGEGKSFVSTNLAYCLAKSGKRVALIDTDFLMPQTSLNFGLAQTSGIMDFLKYEAGYVDIVHTSTINKNLFIIPAGKASNEHTRFLLNGKLDSLFEELSRDFDYLIMDTAPIKLVADIKLFAEYSTDTLFVVRHGNTPLKVLRHIEQTGIWKTLKNVSIVFNGVKQRGMIKDGHGYGYGYDYGHYSENYGYQMEEKLL